MLATKPLALYTIALLATTLAAGSLFAQVSATRESDRTPVRNPSAPPDGALQEIARFFAGGQYALVVEKVDQFVATQAAPMEKVSALFVKAESLHRLGRVGAAVDAYRDALAKLEAATSNVTRRRFAGAYFRYGQILRDQRQFTTALGAVEAGLRLAPQYIEGQILLGQLLAESGQRGRALTHYQTQLASSIPVAEERAVLGIKAARLVDGRSGTSIRPPDFSAALVHSGLSIGIVSINDMPPQIVLADVCALLEGSWRVRCEVLPPLKIAEGAILDPERGQYKADSMLKEIERLLPRAARRQSHVLAITSRDIFGPETSFVFSWQQKNENYAVGVLSTSRFSTEIQDYYEPEIIVTRRVALQALSTTGSMLGFTRPTDPECPLAYPESLREFQQKRLRLCPTEEQQRDQLLRRKGSAAEPFGPSRAEAIAQVYRRYFVE